MVQGLGKGWMLEFWGLKPRIELEMEAMLARAVWLAVEILGLVLA